MQSKESLPGDTAAYARNILVRAAASTVDEGKRFGHDAGMLRYEMSSLGMSAREFAAHKLRVIAMMIETVDDLRDGLQVAAKTVGQLDTLLPLDVAVSSDEPFPSVVRAKDMPAPQRRALTDKEQHTVGEALAKSLMPTEPLKPSNAAA